MCYLRSASGARKEEQGQKAEEERACCFESFPVNTLRSLIAVNKSRSCYSMGICALPMYTVHTHVKPCPSLCCHAENMMFDFVISMLQYFHPSPGANQNRTLSGSIRNRM
jgi:hypothetical protein